MHSYNCDKMSVRRLIMGGQRRCHDCAKSPSAAFQSFYLKHGVGDATQSLTRPIIDTTPREKTFFTNQNVDECPKT